MATRRRLNILSQLRVDVPDLKSIESATSNDFDELLRGLITGAGKSFVIRGFEIEMAGSIGSSANSLQMIVENASILHGNSNTSGTFFVVPSGTPTQTMSSTVNPKVIGSFTPGALNYVGIEYSRQIDNTTAIQRYFWSPSTKSEFVKTVPQAELLDYRIVITSSVFAANVLPISIVETDGANNVLSIEDRRPMLYRLGTAGANTPDPFYEYPWTNQIEGRAENFYISSSSTVSPFRGGDKQIYSMKEMFDALMTEIKLIKGTPYWYSLSAGGSIAKLRSDVANTVVTSKGTVSHSKTTPGKINWSNDINLVVIGSRVKYTILANPTSSDVVLDDDEVAYITLVRDQNVIPNIILTNGSPVATSVGAVSWTTPLVAGDFIKVASGSEDKFYQIQSVDSTSQVTLTQNYLETSTGVNGTKIQYSLGVFQTNPAPSTNRHVKIANRNDVTINQDNYWLFLRQDSGVVSPQETEITTVADIGGSLNGTSFRLASNDNLRKYRFYYNDGTAIDPSDADEIGVSIPLTPGATASQIAIVTADVVDDQSDFTASNVGAMVTVINALEGSSEAGSDVDTGFTFSTIASGVRAKVYARFFGSELEQGETRQISDNVNAEILNYIGARSETDSAPSYSTAFEQISSLSYRLTFPSAASIASDESFVAYTTLDRIKYVPWFNKDGTGSNPAISPEIGVEIVISTGFTNLQVATAAFNALNATGEFNIVNNGNGSIDVTNMLAGRATAPSNTDVGGLTIDVLTIGSGESNNFVVDGENLTQAIKRLDSVIAAALASLAYDAYEEEYQVVTSPTGNYEIAGPIPAGTQITLPLDSRKSFQATSYIVGSAQLEIMLNGLTWRQGQDYIEVGSAGSDSVLIETLYDLEVDDQIVFRIDSDTSVGGGGGSGSGEANTASNAGVTGAGLFKTKVGVDLQFKRVIGGAGVTVFESADAITLSAAPTAPINNVATTVGLDYPASVANDYIRVLNSGVDVTVTLPTATTIGKEIKIKKIDSGNTLFVATVGGDTIDGVNATLTPLIITVQGESIILITGASGAWEIL